MSISNSQRSGCKDVFNAFLVSLAQYAGLFEFPIIAPTYWVPNKLISFSKAINCKDYNQWIHFFEDDVLFERLWRNPRRYLPILRRFNGVILPDFSVFRDMPFVMQLWNIYRSRAIGFWLQQNDVKVIVNIRFGDKRTYRFCCDGISQGCTIAIGSHGTLKNKEDRELFVNGLAYVIKRLEPSTVVVYGATPSAIFDTYRKTGIKVVAFKSEFSSSHRKVL